MKNKQPLFTNENYSVQSTAIIHDGLKVGDVSYDQWYEVINTKTGVIESKTTILPEAMFLWNAYNKSLLTEQWRGADRLTPEKEAECVKGALN
jgi:hypothetical protein